VYVFSPPSNHCPAPAFTTDTASTPLSPNTDRTSLSPVELPVSVNVLGPVPKNAIAPAFPNTSEAWFAAAANASACPVPPDESIVPLPANVNNRSVTTEGVCSAKASVVPAPVYCSVPPEKIRFPAAADDAPIPLATPPFANRVTANTPPLNTVAPVYVFAPDNVTVPLTPFRTTVNAPTPPSANTPVKTDDAVLVELPNETAAPVAAPFRITPAPAGTPSVTKGKSIPEYTVVTAPAPFTSNTPPCRIVVAFAAFVIAPSVAVAPLNRKIPSFTTVLPVKMFAPDNTSVPLPALVNVVAPPPIKDPIVNAFPD
jgi:hypothetical protein